MIPAQPGDRHVKRAAAILLLLSIASIIAVSGILVFDTPPYFENTPVRTNDTLKCSFLLAEDATANITWYLNGALNMSELKSCIAGTVCFSTIPNTQVIRYNTWNCSVFAYNASGYNVSRSVNITISNANPYIINLQQRYTLTEDSRFSMDVDSYDPDQPGVIDGDGVRYSASCIIKDGGTCGGQWDDFPITGAGNVTFTPTNADVGNHTIQIVATDDEPVDGSDKEQIVFDVLAVNDAPFFVNLTNINITDNQYLSYAITADDEENGGGPFSFAINSTVYNISTTDHKHARINYTGNRNSTIADRGNFSIMVNLCDPANTSFCINQSFILQVLPINRPPILLSVPNVTKTQGESLLVYVNATDYDTTATLAFSVSPVNCTITNPWSIETTNSSPNATGMISIIPLNNSHVVCRFLNITVQDEVGQSDSRQVFFNITNANDPPQIFPSSYYSVNSINNHENSHLYAYTDLLFRYRVNATDIDMMTYENDTLQFHTNGSQSEACPDFSINATSGMMEFQSNSSFSGNCSYNISVSDSDSAYDSSIFVIEIIPNSPPFFTEPPANQSALEGAEFYYVINGTDLDGNLGYFSINSSILPMNQSGASAIINYTPACGDIGLHLVTMTLNDTVGASVTGNFSLLINNTPDAPVLPAYSRLYALESKRFTLNISSNTLDNDLNCKPYQDTLTFYSVMLSGQTSFNITITPGGVITFLTQNYTTDGLYTLNVSVVDSYGLSNSTVMEILILNNSLAPDIINITAWNMYDLAAWEYRTLFINNRTDVTLPENTVVIYNHTTIDPEGDPLLYEWYFDGALVNQSHTYIHNYSYSSSGSHNVTLRVQDNVSGIIANNVSFTWRNTVSNVNRPPELVNLLPNLTGDNSLSGTERKERYLTGYSVTYDPLYTRFYDPDGNSLNFTASPTSLVTIEIGSNGSVTFTPLEVGVESVKFTATDGQYNVTSNNVTINITWVPQGSSDDSDDDKKGGGGGSGSPGAESFQTVYQEVEKEIPIYFDLIIPQPITIYLNNTIRTPIVLRNRGNITLRGIALSAVTNISGVRLSFSDFYFPELAPLQEEKTDLIITSYKTFSNYEIVIYANITDPTYYDKAVIYVNSIEKTRGNQSVANTKITFARDLLSSNPECLELNEFIMKAEHYMATGDFDKASEILDSVVQGCKYLVSQQQLKTGKPNDLIIALGLGTIASLRWVMLVIGLALLSILIYIVFRPKHKHRKKQEAQ